MLLAALAIAAGCTRSLPYPTVDIHSHASITGSGASADALASAMDKTKLTHLFLMEEPRAAESAAVSMDSTISFFSAQSARFRYFYGGNELNPIVHALGRTDSITVDSLYPNGALDAAGAQQEVTSLLALQADPAGSTTTFQNRATTAANSGKYVGFGEFGPLHYSRKSGQPYVTFPVNHSLMKWLADLAATKNMVLDIHLEATSGSLAQLEELLAYNRNAKIIWDHAGWTSSGEGTAATVGALMDKHTNLYLSLKLRRPEGKEYRKGNPFDSKGQVRSEWLDLIKKHSARIMVGMDTKIWSEDSDAETALKLTANLVAELLLQLPDDAAAAISNNTAKALFGL